MREAVIRFTTPAAVVVSVAFSPVGSAGVSATTPNLAAGQPAQWVTESYSVLDATPVDGDGRPHPAPPPKSAPHPNPPRVSTHPQPSNQWPQPVSSPPGKLSDCHIDFDGPNKASSVCNGPGAGQQQMVIDCNDDTYVLKNRRTWKALGPWVGRGRPSETDCATSNKKADPKDITHFGEHVGFRG